MMFVFEGPECAGKSTVVRRIAEEYGAKMVKGVRIPNRFQLLASIVDDIRQQLYRTRVGGGERLVVFDRWPLVSDIVYEKYCYDTPSIIDPLLTDLAQACREAGILIVYMSISEDEMVRRFNERGDLLRTLEEAKLTRKAYEQFFSSCKLPFVHINVDGMSLEETYEAVKAAADI